jgi:integrase-like protein
MKYTKTNGKAGEIGLVLELWVSYDKKFRTFEEAKEFSHKLGLKSQTEWRKYCKSGKRPANIPSNPISSYGKKWKGWGDWLGTGTVANQNRAYRSFIEARKFIRSLGLKSFSDWINYCKTGKKPDYVPASPEVIYKNQWKGWGDWLGTGTVATRNRGYRSFEQARIFTRSLGLKGKEDWINYCKSGKKPLDIPQKPYRTYKSDWVWWGDWLGYENPEWVVRRVKELLQDLIKSGIIYKWNEAVLYSFLLRKGVLSLEPSNRHARFFKNLIEASHTDEGRKAIEDYANSESEVPPDLSKLIPTSKGITQEQDEEIVSASSQELTSLTENVDPLDYGEIKTAEQILAQTNVLESTNVDEEAMQFYMLSGTILKNTPFDIIS